MLEPFGAGSADAMQVASIFNLMGYVVPILLVVLGLYRNQRKTTREEEEKEDLIPPLGMPPDPYYDSMSRVMELEASREDDPGGDRGDDTGHDDTFREIDRLDSYYAGELLDREIEAGDKQGRPRVSVEELLHQTPHTPIPSDTTTRSASIGQHLGIAAVSAEPVGDCDVPRHAMGDIRLSFKGLRQARRPPTVLEPRQLRAVLKWLSLGARTFALVIASSGGRPVEVASLQVQDIDRGKGSPWPVTFRATKEKSPRTSFLAPDAEAALTEMLEDRLEGPVFFNMGLTPEKVLARMRVEWITGLAGAGGLDQAFDAKGNRAFKLYSLRRYFRVQLAQGMAIDDVKALMRALPGGVDDYYAGRNLITQARLRASYKTTLDAGAFWGNPEPEREAQVQVDPPSPPPSEPLPEAIDPQPQVSQTPASQPVIFRQRRAIPHPSRFRNHQELGRADYPSNRVTRGRLAGRRVPDLGKRTTGLHNEAGSR